MRKFKIILLFLCLVTNLAWAEDQSILFSRVWTLITLRNAAIILDQYGTEKPNIIFDQTKQTFTAYTGCNRISGKYTLSGSNALEFAPNMVITELACPNVPNIETDYIYALTKVKFWEVSDNFLNLQNELKSTLASFAGVDAY